MDHFLVKITAIFLVLLAGIFSYRRRKRRQQEELNILNSILITLNHEITHPVGLILANISLLLNPGNRLAGENKLVIHRLETAASRIRGMIFQLSQIDRVDLSSYLEARKKADATRSR